MIVNSFGRRELFTIMKKLDELVVAEDGVGDVGLLEAADLLASQGELHGGQGVGDMPQPGGADDGFPLSSAG